MSTIERSEIYLWLNFWHWDLLFPVVGDSLEELLDLDVGQAFPGVHLKCLCARLDVADINATLRREEDLIVVAQGMNTDVVFLRLGKDK